MTKYIRTLLIFFVCTATQAFSQSSPAIYTPDFLYERGLEMVEKSNFTEARSSFENYLLRSGNEDSPKRTFAEYYVAFAALNLYHLDAEQLFVSFVASHPSHPKAVKANYDLGMFFAKDKNYNNAIVYLSKVDYSQLTDEQQREARFNLAYAYFSQRKFSDALTNFNMLKSKLSAYKSASAYYAAYIEYNQKDYETALNDLRIAENGEAYKSLVPIFVCNIYYHQQQYDQLISYGQDVVANRSKLSNRRDIYLLVGEGFFQKKDYQQASVYYDEFKKRNKGKPTTEVALRMAITDFNLDNNEAAMSNLKLVAGPNSETGLVASYYLGGLYVRDNNLEYAAAAYKIAANQEINLDIAEKARFQYGKISTDMGRSLEAVNNLNAYLELYPSGPHVHEVNELLSLAYLNSKNLDVAIDHMEALPSLTSRTKEAYQKATFLKGNQLYNQREYRNAIAMYDKSLKYPVDDDMRVGAYYWKSEAYSIGRLYAEAKEGYLVVERSNNNLKISASYGLGYCLFNEKAYGEALGHFKNFVENYTGPKSTRIYQDASLRLADCYYVSKDYSRALSMYNNAVQVGIREKDYAYMQLGTLENINGDETKAKGYLKRVIRDFPKSSYVDDALFELANIDYQKGNYQTSVVAFSTIIDDKPNSPYVPYSLQRRAIAHFNLQTYGRTEEDYKIFLSKFPVHPEANNVLLGLQEVMNLNDKQVEFEEILAAYKVANPDIEGIEVVEFETAKGYYNNQDYDRAIAALTAYRNSYPTDAKSYDAQFLIAESYYRKGENYNALPIYYEILVANQISQTLRVIQRIADLEYAERNYTKAANYYDRLGREAFTQRQTINSWVGLMKTNFQLSQYDQTTLFADKIIDVGTVNVGIQNAALLYKGKVAYALGNYDGAIGFFEQTVENAKDLNAAEAMVLIGEVLYNQKKYVESNEHLFTISANFSVFDEWIGKAFLQVSENYIAMEEFLQARATLNSIIENTPSGVIANLAKVKLDRLDELDANRVVQQDTLQVDTLYVAPSDTTIIGNGGNNE